MLMFTYSFENRINYDSACTTSKKYFFGQHVEELPDLPAITENTKALLVKHTHHISKQESHKILI